MSYENSSLVTCKFIKITFLKQNKNLKNAVHISLKNIYNILCKHKYKRGLTTTKNFTKIFSTKNNIENISFLPGVTVGAAGGPLHYTLTAGVLREE